MKLDNFPPSRVVGSKRSGVHPTTMECNDDALCTLIKDSTWLRVREREMEREREREREREIGFL